MKLIVLALLACICLCSRISHRLDSSSTESALAKIEALLEAQSLAEIEETEGMLEEANEEFFFFDPISAKKALDSFY